MFASLRRPVLVTLVTLGSLLGAPTLSRAQQAPPFGVVTLPVLESSAASQGQNQRHHEGVGFGLKVGPQFSSLSGNTNYSKRTGLIGGVFFGGNRPGRVGVQADVLYAKKGISVPGAPVDLHYIEIPVMMRVNFGSENLDRVSFYVLAGPVADVILKAKQRNLDVASNYQRLDVGVLFGAGVEITRFLIEIRENLGLRSVLSSSGGSSTSFHLRTFEALVGIRIN